jgi:ATP synthase protein I
VQSTEVRGRNLNGNYTRFAGLGFTFMILIGVFTFGGYGLDRLLGTMPLFVLVGMVVGFVAALYYLFVKLRELGGG